MTKNDFSEQIIAHIEDMHTRAMDEIHVGGQREEPYNKGYLAAFRDIIASLREGLETRPDEVEGL